MSLDLQTIAYLVLFCVAFCALALPQGRCGLETIRELLIRLGDPQKRLPPVPARHAITDIVEMAQFQVAHRLESHHPQPQLALCLIRRGAPFGSINRQTIYILRIFAPEREHHGRSGGDAWI